MIVIWDFSSCSQLFAADFNASEKYIKYQEILLLSYPNLLHGCGHRMSTRCTGIRRSWGFDTCTFCHNFSKLCLFFGTFLIMHCNFFREFSRSSACSCHDYNFFFTIFFFLFQFFFCFTDISHCAYLSLHSATENNK